MAPTGGQNIINNLVTSLCLLSRKVWSAEKYFTDQNGPKRGNEFWVFSNSDINITNSWAEKVDEKNGIICLVSMFPSWFMVLKLSKKEHFCNFVLSSARNLSLLKLYGSERSRYALSENGSVYYAMIYCFGDIRVWSWRILLNFCRVSIFFNILIANISWTVAEIPINHTIFWKSVMRTFRYI